MPQVLDILRAEALKLTPESARVGQWYTTTHLRLSDLWRTALVTTLGQVAGSAPVPFGPDLDRALGTPGAWADGMLISSKSYDLRCWLRQVQELANRHDVTAPPHAGERSA